MSINIYVRRFYLHDSLLICNTGMNLGSAGDAFGHLHRRVIAGAIAFGLSLHQRSRLHFVRGSREEAARVAENHLENGNCSVSDGFSARNVDNYVDLSGSWARATSVDRGSQEIQATIDASIRKAQKI